jgi:hypothetical protein
MVCPTHLAIDYQITTWTKEVNAVLLELRVDVLPPTLI